MTHSMPMPPGFQLVSDCSVSTPAGPIASDAPFQPFGPQPTCGACLMLESAELLGQDWDAVAILIDWVQPQGNFDFASHYAAYNATLAEPVFCDAAFRLQASWQTSSGWNEVAMSDSRLFQPEVDQQDWASCFVLQRAQAPGRTGIGSPAGLKDSGRACIRLELSSPAQAFGHGLYAEVLLAVMAAHAGSESQQPLVLPNPPFAALARRLRVGLRLAASLTPVMGVSEF